MVAERCSDATRNAHRIVDVLVPLVMEAIVKAVLASLIASENRCARVTADHVSSDKVFAEESKVTETSVVEGHTHPLSQMSLSTGVYTTMDFKGAEAVTMVRRLEEHSALSQVASSLSVVMKCGPNVGEAPFAQVKKLITDLINELRAEASPEANHKPDHDAELTRHFTKNLETQLMT